MKQTALDYAKVLLAAIPSLLTVVGRPDAALLATAAGKVLDLLEEGNAKLRIFAAEKRDPNDFEWDELNSSIAEKRMALHS